MKGTFAWAAIFGVWLVGVLGSVLVVLVEVTDGSQLSSGFTIAMGVLGVCVAAAVGYLVAVPKDSRPPAKTWLLAAAFGAGLMLLMGLLALMSALGVIRG